MDYEFLIYKLGIECCYLRWYFQQAREHTRPANSWEPKTSKITANIEFPTLNLKLANHYQFKVHYLIIENEYYMKCDRD